MSTCEGVVVGRRPVIDPRLSVVGYKLAVGGDGAPLCDAMTQEIAERTADRDGITPVFGSKLGFVRPSRPYLVGEEQLPLPAEQAVIEIDAALGRDSDVVAGCARLVGEGVRLAVGDPDGLAADGPLADMASYTLVDIAGTGLLRLGELVERNARPGLRLVAVGVDSPDQLEAARGAGFDLFEGRILSRPVHVVTEALTPNRLTCLHMLEKVNDPDTSAADLERVVETDPGLSYRLLHVSGMGAAGGLRRPVRSIREATVLLGREWIQRWLVLMLVADANHGTPEQMSIAMTRGRMCELVAEDVSPAQSDAAFTVGLVSALDLLLGGTLPDVVDKLAITDDLKAALLERSGTLGNILADVVDWELGTPPSPLRSGLERLGAEGHYLEALRWAGELAGPVQAAA